MTVYGVTNDYEYAATHKRECLTIWSGAFMSVYEATGYFVGGGYVHFSCIANPYEEED